MFCGSRSKKLQNVNLRAIPINEVVFKVLTENNRHDILQLSTDYLEWSRTVEKSEEEKKIDLENKKAQQQAEEEDELLERKAERQEREFAEKVAIQQGELIELRRRNEVLERILNETKREYLINAIKNETLKKMIQQDQEDFIKYSDYKFTSSN